MEFDRQRRPLDMSDRPMEVIPESRRGTTRWQVVVAIIGFVVLLILGMRMGAGGDHGPGQDTPVEEQQEDGGHVPPPGVPDHG